MPWRRGAALAAATRAGSCSCAGRFGDARRDRREARLRARRRRRARHRRVVDAARRGRARLLLPPRRPARHAHGAATGASAADLVNAAAEAELADIICHLRRGAAGAGRIARAIVASARQAPHRRRTGAAGRDRGAALVRAEPRRHRSGDPHLPGAAHRRQRRARRTGAGAARRRAGAEARRPAGRGHLPFPGGPHRQAVPRSTARGRRPGGSRHLPPTPAADADLPRVRRKGRRCRARPRWPPIRARARRKLRAAERTDAPAGRPLATSTPLAALPAAAEARGARRDPLHARSCHRRADRLGGLRLFDQIRDARPCRAGRQAQDAGAEGARDDRGAEGRMAASSTGRSACRRRRQRHLDAAAARRILQIDPACRTCRSGRRGPTRSARKLEALGLAGADRHAEGRACRRRAHADRPYPGEAIRDHAGRAASVHETAGRCRARADPRLRRGRGLLRLRRRQEHGAASAFVGVVLRRLCSLALGGRLVLLGVAPEHRGGIRRATLVGDRGGAARHHSTATARCWPPTSRPSRSSPSRATSSTRTRPSSS